MGRRFAWKGAGQHRTPSILYDSDRLPLRTIRSLSLFAPCFKTSTVAPMLQFVIHQLGQRLTLPPVPLRLFIPAERTATE